jgi:diadenosine tetraphosphatase ApaH/serine/threonine PP2A family protein phosphatase
MIPVAGARRLSRDGWRCGSKGLEICEELVGWLSETEMVLTTRVAETFLQGAEEAVCTRETQCHGSELSKQLVSMSDRQPLLAREDGVKHLFEACDLVQRELDGPIQYPTKDDLVCQPSPIHHTRF